MMRALPTPPRFPALPRAPAPSPRSLDWLRPAIHPRTLAFAVRTTISTLLSLWLAFRLQLDNPYLGAVTIWLVARPGVRATMTLSIARFIGTLAGCLGAVFIMAIVAQEPVTALLAIALWMAGCSVGATLELVPEYAYTFQLAGFSILTAVAASVPDPNRAFIITVDQCAGVCCGVASLFVVDAVFPYGIDAPPSPPPPRTKGTMADAVRAGLITAGTVVLAGSFWMATAWPDGVYFLFAAGLVTVFFAPTLTPDVRALGYARGIILSGLIAALYTFAILPHYTAFVEFAIVMAPLLLALGVAVAIPRLAQGGAVLVAAYLFILFQPTNAQRIDPLTVFNRDLAYALGGVLGTVTFRLGGRATFR
jgi:uncharacterized membrane protein YccC